MSIVRSPTPFKAPFVSQDSVYGYLAAQLDSGQTELAAAGAANFPFVLPPGFSGNVGGADFSSPAGFRAFNRALKAKVLVLRGSLGCGATCFSAALTALSQSFLDLPAISGLAHTTISAPLGRLGQQPLRSDRGHRVLALDAVLQSQAQPQPNGDPDQRLLNKLVPAPTRSASVASQSSARRNSRSISTRQDRPIQRADPDHSETRS